MNHCFKSVFNRSLGVWQTTSELTMTAGKTGRTCRISPSGRLYQSPGLSGSTLEPNTRLAPLCKGISLAFATTLIGLASQQALADCTPNPPPVVGTAVFCTGGTTFGNAFSSTVDFLRVNVSNGATVAPLNSAPTTAMSLTGNGISLTNAGLIDPSGLGSPNALVKGVIVGNGNASSLIITNVSPGRIYGTYDAASVVSGDLSGLALDIRNGAGGTTTITNNAIIGGKPLTGVSPTVSPFDAAILASSGLGNTNLTNAAGASIQGRIGLSGTSNILTNNGQILGSVYMGNGNDTFVADTASSVSSSGTGTAVQVTDAFGGVGTINFAAAGIVDGGAGTDTLTLKSNAGNDSSTASAAQYINFENLNITGGTWSLTGRLADSSNLTGGTIILNDANNLGNTATVSGAAIQAGAAGLGVTTALTIQGGGLTVQGNNSFSLSGVIDGTGKLTKNDAGILTLGAANTWSGGMAVNGGGLVLGNSHALGTGAVDVNASITLDSSAPVNIANNINLVGASTLLNVLGVNQPVTLSGVVAGAGGMVKNGAQTLTLTGANTFTGGLEIAAGTVTIGAGGSLAATGAVKLSGLGSLLDISGAGNQTIGAMSGIAGATISLGGNTLTFGDATNQIMAGSISDSGAGSLVKTGAGIQTLSGNNTFSGGVSLNAGGLILGRNGSLGTGTLTVNGATTLDGSVALNLSNNVNLASGGALNLLGTLDLTFNGLVQGTGSLTKSGASTLTLNGANTFSGGVTANAGSLTLGNSNSLGTGTLTVGGSITLNNSAALTLANNVSLAGGSLSLSGGQDLTLGGTLQGAGGLVKNGGGTLTLDGANTFSGGVTENSGALMVGNNNALGTGTLTVGGFMTIDSSAAVTLANNVALNGGLDVLGSNDITINGAVSGTGSLTKDGAGKLTLNGTNTYTGGTNINAGTLALGAGASLYVNGTVNLASGATFDLSAGNGTQTFGNIIGSGNLVLGTNSLTIGGPTDGNFSGLIGGTGGIIKEGTGTQTLTGANTYAGATSINAGTLAIGAGGSIAATSAVTLNAAGTGFDISGGGNQTIGSLAGVAGSTITVGANTLTLGGAANTSFDGFITGSGGLAKNGAGVQELGGSNNFSGGVALNAGGLALGNNNALGTGALTVGGNTSLDNIAALNLANNVNLQAGTSLDILGSNALTLGGAISGSGGLIKDGASTLTLAGANSYTGGTTINSGTLAVGSGGSLASSSAVNIGATGALDISAGSSQTIKTLNGVAGSTIALGGNTLTLGDSSNAVFNGSIGGSGGRLVKSGSGVQTLNGANTFSGGVTLNAGGLIIGSNAALGTGALTINGAATLDSTSLATLANDVVLNAGLSLSGSNDMNLGGALSGTGGLTKNGATTLTLNGSNTYTGGTIINAGTLRITNTNASAMTVNTGATLAGTGAVGSVVNNAAVHVETGTLAVNGDYSQNAGGLLRIDAAGAATGQYSKLNVSGIATFGAGATIDVNVNALNTLASGNVLSSVIQAGTLNASTFTVTDNSALFNFRATVNGNAVDLSTVQAATTADAVAANGASSATGAARVLDNIFTTGASGDMASVITALGTLTSQRDVSRAVAQTLPLSGGVTQSTMGMLGAFGRVLQNRTSGNAGSQGNQGGSIGRADGISGVATGEQAANHHVWAKAFGSRADQDDQNGASGFSANSWGTAFGADSEITPDTLFGVSYAYANSRVDGNTALSGAAQHANIDSHVLGIYGNATLPNAMQLNAQADIGRNHADGSRSISFGGLNSTATSSYASYSAHAGAGISKEFSVAAHTTFTPEVRFDYTRLRAQGYSESGAGALNLSVDANTTSAFVLSAAARVRQDLTRHSWLDFNLGAGYDAINDRGDVVSVFAGAPGQSFATTGLSHSPWLVNVGIGYTYQTDSGTQLILRYDADGRDGYLNQTASVKAGWMF
jgi:fibronectin-binding autotransporter adhesin